MKNQAESYTRKEVPWAMGYCLVVALVFFRGAVFLPGLYHIPYDLEEYHQPMLELIAWSLREFGQVPWWNPFSYFGEPFFGNVQAAMFYPPTLATALLGNLLFRRVTYWLVEMQLVAHVALAGAGTYVLLRTLRVTRASAILAATVYQMGPFFSTQTQHLGAISGAAWLPWLLAALRVLAERRDLRWCALAALPLALMIAAGFPAVYLPAFFFAPFLYCWWNWGHLRLGLRSTARTLAPLVASLALAVLLSAVSWLPGYSVSKGSLAARRPIGPALHGLRWEAATSLVWPNLFNQLRGDPWLQENTTFLHMYQGIGPLVLLACALPWLIGRARARPFLVAAGLALVWMFGQTFFLSEFFYFLYPSSVNRGLYPSFLLAYFCVCFAVLAGLALDGYQSGERPHLLSEQVCSLGALFGVAAALLVCVAGAFSGAGSQFGVRMAASGGTLFLVAFSLALLALLVRSCPAAHLAQRSRVAALFCAIVALDLLSIGSHTRNNTYEGQGDTVPGAASFLMARLPLASGYRIDTDRIGYSWQTKVAQWRLASANGMNPLLLVDTVVYRAPFSELEDRQFTLPIPDSPLVDLAGVRYIVTSAQQLPGSVLIYEGNVNVFENRRAFPRFFLVGDVVPCRGVAEAAFMIHERHADPARVAVVSPDELGHFRGLSGPATSAELGAVEVVTYSPNEVRLRVTATRAAVLVATDTYWPDWRATVDGKASPISRADGLFRAIAVPAGDHTVRMTMAPRALYAGGAISLSALFLCICLVVIPRSRHEAAPAMAARSAAGQA